MQQFTRHMVSTYTNNRKEKDIMAKEKTSTRVAKIASAQLKSKTATPKAKTTAGSALTQYEPKRKGKRK